MNKSQVKNLAYLSSKCPSTEYEYSQESKGIRQWPINWSTSPMMIHKNYPFCRLQLKQWLKRLDTGLMNYTIKIKEKSPKLFSRRIILKLWGLVYLEVISEYKNIKLETVRKANFWCKIQRKNTFLHNYSGFK